MTLKLRLAQLAAGAERLVDRLRPARRRGPPVIEPYLGHATPEHLVLRGRVLSRLTGPEVAEGQSRWVNFRQMVRLFLTDERPGVPVTAGGFTDVSDEEGYVTLFLPRMDDTEGWVEIEARADGSLAPVKMPALVPSKEAVRGVISDIDDTMMQTGAYSLRKNLWTSLTGNALTRVVFPDALELMTKLHGETNPVYYVSSSPWNLHGFLDAVFARHGLVRGPMFLRDYGVSETQFITGTHGDHKGAAIDTILAANPTLPFTLVGDTGQHDCEVYRAAAERHPGRIERAIFRAPGRGVDSQDRTEIAALRELGVQVFAGADFRNTLAGLE